MFFLTLHHFDKIYKQYLFGDWPVCYETFFKLPASFEDTPTGVMIHKSTWRM